MNADTVKKCAVVECNSESSRNSLAFQMFPSTKRIALKWLKNLEHLIQFNLLFQPVQQFYICKKHFEHRFLLKSGTIADNAYPTLFTPNEIVTGVPENFENGEYQTYMDHNYCMLRKDIPDSYFTQNNNLKYQYTRKEKCGNMDETESGGIYPVNFKDTRMKNITGKQHNLASLEKKNNNEDSSNIDTTINFDNDTPIDNDTHTAMDSDDVTSANKQQINGATNISSLPRTTLRSHHSNTMSNSSKVLQATYKACLRQVKRLKNVINIKNQRIKQMKFDKKTCFDKLTKHVSNPLAKKFIWMQVRSAPKNAHGRRFTDEEKTICMYIKNQNPQCYRILSKIFTLPSKRSLKKFLKTEMAPKNKVDS